MGVDDRAVVRDRRFEETVTDRRHRRPASRQKAFPAVNPLLRVFRLESGPLVHQAVFKSELARRAGGPAAGKHAALFHPHGFDKRGRAVAEIEYRPDAER